MGSGPVAAPSAYACVHTLAIVCVLTLCPQYGHSVMGPGGTLSSLHSCRSSSSRGLTRQGWIVVRHHGHCPLALARMGGLLAPQRLSSSTEVRVSMRLWRWQAL